MRDEQNAPTKRSQPSALAVLVRWVVCFPRRRYFRRFSIMGSPMTRWWVGSMGNILSNGIRRFLRARRVGLYDLYLAAAFRNHCPINSQH
jgi:hypothetical protein